MLILVTLVSTASAQDPVVNAAATIQAATIQAGQYRAAQSARATAQAQSALATTQAQSALATQSAQAELDQQRGTTITAQALESLATRQAIGAAATSQAMLVQAVATRQAIDAEATRAAHAAALVESRKRTWLGTALLYVAGLMALIGCAYVAWKWGRSAGRKASIPPDAPVVEPIIVDGDFAVQPAAIPQIAGPARRMGNVRIVDDPDITAQALDIFDQYWRKQHGDTN